MGAWGSGTPGSPARPRFPRQLGFFGDARLIRGAQGNSSSAHTEVSGFESRRCKPEAFGLAADDFIVGTARGNPDGSGGEVYWSTSV